jgi:Fe-S cluster biosynthesis and repair protein YggX
MTRLIHCKKLNKEAEGFITPPIPGELGQQILADISVEAWQLWINHQTMLINEYRLSMIDPKARTYLREEMQKFLFGGGSEKPPGFVGK